jgi:hypothetical protein
MALDDIFAVLHADVWEDKPVPQVDLAKCISCFTTRFFFLKNTEHFTSSQYLEL